MDAFDADVLIYAAAHDHPLGAPIRELFRRATARDRDATAGIGSVLLLPELLSKPLRDRDSDDARGNARDELDVLTALLGRLDLLPVDLATASVAAALGARYRLCAADAVHLATAVSAGADRFITNNSSDFPAAITEIAIVTPADVA